MQIKYSLYTQNISYIFKNKLKKRLKKLLHLIILIFIFWSTIILKFNKK